MINHSEISDFQEGEETFFLKGPAGRLEMATSMPRTEEKGVVSVICHPHPLYQGTMHNKVVTTVARTFREMGVPAVRFNFRGVGGSEGGYDNGQGETEDLLAVLQWVKKVRPKSDVWLAGFSFGSYIALKGSTLWPAKQLILVAPPVTNFDFSHLQLPNCPCLVIQGDADEVIDAKAVFAWIESLPNPPKLIRLTGASHFFHGRLTELREILQRELAPYLS